MGMRQRLGLATALLGDPPAVVLDEPANGLDPEGIVWMRGLLRAFADEGRTVLVSSHVLAEVQHTVDDVVIIARGRLVHASSLAELAELAEPETYVESPDPPTLATLRRDRGWTARAEGAGLRRPRRPRGRGRRRGVRRWAGAPPARQPRRRPRGRLPPADREARR